MKYTLDRIIDDRTNLKQASPHQVLSTTLPTSPELISFFPIVFFKKGKQKVEKKIKSKSFSEEIWLHSIILLLQQQQDRTNTQIFTPWIPIFTAVITFHPEIFYLFFVFYNLKFEYVVKDLKMGGETGAECFY